LIAIADAFGADWAMRAREAALVYAGRHQDEDAAVILLPDIRDIFNGVGVDRFLRRQRQPTVATACQIRGSGIFHRGAAGRTGEGPGR
jgi:hypothetical protein